MLPNFPSPVHAHWTCNHSDGAFDAVGACAWTASNNEVKNQLPTSRQSQNQSRLKRLK